MSKKATDLDALNAFFDTRESAPAEEAGPAVEGAVPYTVTGPHRVHGVRRGETVELDPENPETAFLVKHGHIAPQTGADQED